MSLNSIKLLKTMGSKSKRNSKKKNTVLQFSSSMNLLCATVTTSREPAPALPLMCIKCIFNFTSVLLTLVWKGIWKGNWEWLGCLLCTFHCFTTSFPSPLIFLLCKIQSEPSESFLTETFPCLRTLPSPPRPLSGCSFFFFYRVGVSIATAGQGYWS